MVEDSKLGRTLRLTSGSGIVALALAIVAMGAMGAMGAACAADVDAPPLGPTGDSLPANGDFAVPSDKPIADAQDDGSASLQDAAPRSDGGLGYIPVAPEDAGPDYVCSKTEAVFDLSALAPIEPQTPAPIVSAWAYEVPYSVPSVTPSSPALVLALTGTRLGPITARFGGVQMVFNAPYVAPLGEGTASISIPYNATDRTRLTLPRSSVDAALTVGLGESRRSIRIAAIAFDFRTDVACGQIDGSLTLEIPWSQNQEGNVAFGQGTTLAEVFGPLNVDTNFDGTLDGWQVQLSTLSRSSAPAIAMSP
jgi:hypothetical protein